MKHLLFAAKSEIERLRRQNEILRAKVEVIDMVNLLLHTHPGNGGAMCVDVAWELQRAADEIELEEKRKNPPPGMNHFCRGESGSGERPNGGPR